MKTIIILLALTSLCLTRARGAESAKETLQKALWEEEINQNFEAAARQYQSVIDQSEEQRKVIATAVFRLGECQRKLGKTNEAILQYQRIAREFADLQLVFKPSQEYLQRWQATLMPAMASANTGGPSPAMVDEQQQRLLEQEIDLVKKQVAEATARHANGKGTEDEIIRFKIDLLRLTRQRPQESATEPQRQSIQEEIDMVKQLLAINEAKVKTGVAPPLSKIPLERELLALQRELAKLDSTPSDRSRGVSNLTDAGMRLAEPGSATNAPVYITSEEDEEIKRIQAMIRNSPDLINARAEGKEDYGLTPLHKAAKKGQMLVARFLLENGADPNAIEAQHWRRAPLHFAALNGHLAVGELLLSKGANINALDESEATPLDLAVTKGFRAVVKTLMDKGAQIHGEGKTKGTSSLFLAIFHKQPAIVDLLLEAKADVNARSGQQEDRTCLMEAAAYSKAIAERLLSQGAEVDAVDRQGNSALLFAARNKQTEIVDLLLRHPADPNRRNQENETPLGRAIAANDVAMVKLLLAKGAKVNDVMNFFYPSKDRPGEFYAEGVISPLYAAVTQRNPDLVDLLLQQQANPDGQVSAKEQSGAALMRAVANQELKICQLLLDHGAKVQWINSEGDTPLHYAARLQNREITALLLKYHADPNAVNRSGETPLNIAKSMAAGGQSRMPGRPGTVPRVFPTRVGPTPVPTPLPPLPGQPTTASPNQASASTMAGDAITELLRQAGGNDHYRRLQAIWLSRPTLNIYEPFLNKDTNAVNRFSLGELVAGGLQNRSDRSDVFRRYADLSQIKIKRLDSATGQDKVIPIDYDAILKSGDYSREFWLEWGDVVEIPEEDHLVNEPWPGPKNEWLAGLRKCLQRKIQLVVRGRTNELILKPLLPEGRSAGTATNFTISAEYTVLKLATEADSAPPEPKIIESFNLFTVVRVAGVLRASSDLSRVKVTRVDPVSGQRKEMLYDCRDTLTNNDLWLRDGDIIEIVDK